MANTVAGISLTGTHAARPAGNAVPDGTLYSCTTHNLIYQSNYAGNSWATWATLGTAASGSITASGYTQNTARLLGRTTAAAGAIEEITVGSGLSLSAGSLTATGGAGGVAVAAVQGTGSADYTCNSATYIDVDGTNLTITTTNAQAGDLILCKFMFGTDGSNTGNMAVTFDVAGTDVGDTLGLMFAGSGVVLRTTISYLHTMASGTQITVKQRWKTASGVPAMYNRTAVIRPYFSLTNLTRSGTL